MRQPMRVEAATTLADDCTVVVYERNGGLSCLDELYAIYPDGRTISYRGHELPRTDKVDASRVSELLATIDDLGFFTDLFYTTYHAPCPACHQYSVTLIYRGQAKTIGFVDGGTDGPAQYWILVGYLEDVLGIES